MPARMPTMATTIISSMSVKPLARSTRDAKASAPSGHLLKCCCLNKCVHLTITCKTHFYRILQLLCDTLRPFLRFDRPNFSRILGICNGFARCMPVGQSQLIRPDQRQSGECEEQYHQSDREKALQPAQIGHLRCIKRGSSHLRGANS